MASRPKQLSLVPSSSLGWLVEAGHSVFVKPRAFIVARLGLRHSASLFHLRRMKKSRAPATKPKSPQLEEEAVGSAAAGVVAPALHTYQPLEATVPPSCAGLKKMLAALTDLGVETRRRSLPRPRLASPSGDLDAPAPRVVLGGYGQFIRPPEKL